MPLEAPDFCLPEVQDGLSAFYAPASCRRIRINISSIMFLLSALSAELAIITGNVVDERRHQRNFGRYADGGPTVARVAGQGRGWARKRMKKLAGAVPGMFGALLKDYTDIGRFAIGRTKKNNPWHQRPRSRDVRRNKKLVWDKKDEAVDAVKGTLGGMLGGTRKIFSNILERWLNFGD
jgi:hypothetical protein